jgi:hypothetical protein
LCAALLCGKQPPRVWAGEQVDAAKPASQEPEAPHALKTLRGRVVWVAEALHRRFGIETDADAAESLVALETAEGELHPIVKDFRGRAFHMDPRLRNMDLELVVRQFKQSPLVQVVGVYSLKTGGKYEVDYWCEICAIPMFEPKLCECCQEPNELRERKVATGGSLNQSEGARSKVPPAEGETPNGKS